MRRLAVLMSAAVVAVSCAETPPEELAETEDVFVPREDEPVDPLAPRSSGENAPILQLHTATICTNDLDASLAFYRDALGLDVRGPIEIDDDTRAVQRKLWGIPENIGWDTYVLSRPGVEGTVQIRLLSLDQATPAIVSSYVAMEPGPFSLGFPTEDAEAWDLEIRERGYESLAPIEKYSIPRKDGTSYGIHETIFNGPDFVHAVIISRRDGVGQLGPVDPATGHGGPVYSAQSVQSSDEVLKFYTDLGMEIRSDREWKAGEGGALGIPAGTPFRFAITYAEGATFGHQLWIDFRDGAHEGSGVAPRPPNRGLGMWSFPVRDMDDMVKRAESAGLEVLAGPEAYESPALGSHRAMTLIAPNGFLVELFEPAGS